MSASETCPQCGATLDADRPQGLCPACLLRQAMNSQATAPVPEGTHGGAPFDPPTPLELAQGFPQLEILELIGRGGMGAVYKSRQRALDRVVALKVLPPAVKRDPSFEERFTREARALARVSHPNIVNVYEFGQSASGLFYFVMEFVDGVNLRQMLRSHQLKPAEALAIVPQICDALQYAHDEGIVHRDIKPENILVDRKGRVKIADFGLAKILSPKPTDYTLTSPQMVMGTPHYMAPEQLEKPNSVDHRADIYSLGVVFYEMLTGELPLGRFSPPSTGRIEIDVRLDDVVLKTLEKEPDRRYQRVGMVKTDLATIASQHAVAPGVAAAADAAAPARQMSPRQRWIVLLCALGMPLFFIVSPRLFGWRLEIGTLTGVGAMLLFVIGSIWESLPPQRRRWLYHPASLMVLMLLIPPLFKALENPTPMLERLYAVFGGTMRRHDVPAAKVIAGVLIAYVFVYLVAVYRHLWPTFFPKRGKAPAPPGAERTIGTVAEEGLAVAREQVRGPAIGLVATGVLNWFGMFVAVAVLYYLKFHRNGSVPDWVFILVMPILTFGSGLILFGALKMMRLESVAWARFASVLAMVIGPGYLIGWPVGIWSLVTLARPEVQSGFRRGREAWRDAVGRTGGDAMPAAASPGARAALWVVAILAAIGFLPYNQSHDASGTVRTTMGLFDPWYVSVSGQYSRVNLFTWSALFGVVALVAGWLLARGSPKQAEGAPAPGHYTLLPSRPRLSRAAIIGAFLAPLPLLAMPAYLVPVESAGPVSEVRRQAIPVAPSETATTLPAPEERLEVGETAPPRVMMAVILTLALVVAPPLLTTILGLVAISHIRASRGRLYGLPLAIADALLYPLLALDVLIGVFWYFALPNDGTANVRAVVILTVVTSVLVDLWLVRLCWRGARSPAEERLAYGA